MSRHSKQRCFLFVCRFMTVCVIGTLGLLLYHIFHVGLDRVDFGLFSNFPSRFAHSSGLRSALFGTLWIIALTALISIPIGVSTAVYLEEYAPPKKWVHWLRINILNLAGMPSIIYGLVGLAVFVRWLGLERSILAGALTLSLVILPVIIIATQGALASVPRSIRDGAYALGARKWQVVWSIVLPSALPGILTGIILSLSRAIGETAPLIMIGAASYIAFTPQNLADSFTVLPIQIYNWASRPQAEFHTLAAAGIIILMAVLMIMNVGAAFIRERSQRFRI